MENESLSVDFADRADIRAKLPHAREILAGREARLRDAREQVRGWMQLVELMERLSGVGVAIETQARDTGATPDVTPPPAVEQPQEPTPKTSRPVDLVVEVVNREHRKIRSKDVARILQREGHDLSLTAVSNSLHYAAARAEPPRVRKAQGRGFYAPLDYQEASKAPPTNLAPPEGAENGHEPGGPNPGAQLEDQKSPGEQIAPAHPGLPYSMEGATGVGTGPVLGTG